jgi:hypothetical protein
MKHPESQPRGSAALRGAEKKAWGFLVPLAKVFAGIPNETPRFSAYEQRMDAAYPLKRQAATSSLLAM